MEESQLKFLEQTAMEFLYPQRLQGLSQLEIMVFTSKMGFVNVMMFYLATPLQSVAQRILLLITLVLEHKLLQET